MSTRHGSCCLHILSLCIHAVGLNTNAFFRFSFLSGCCNVATVEHSPWWRRSQCGVPATWTGVATLAGEWTLSVPCHGDPGRRCCRRGNNWLSTMHHGSPGNLCPALAVWCRWSGAFCWPWRTGWAQWHWLQPDGRHRHWRGPCAPDVCCPRCSWRGIFWCGHPRTDPCATGPFGPQGSLHAPPAHRRLQWQRRSRPIPKCHDGTARYSGWCGSHLLWASFRATQAMNRSLPCDADWDWLFYGGVASDQFCAGTGQFLWRAISAWVQSMHERSTPVSWRDFWMVSGNPGSLRFVLQAGSVGLTTGGYEFELLWMRRWANNNQLDVLILLNHATIGGKAHWSQNRADAGSFRCDMSGQACNDIWC